MIRAAFATLILAAASYSSPAQAQKINSHLLVDAGQQFVLGGDQKGAFRVSARNAGPVPVSVGERLANGQVLERGRLEPQGQVLLRFTAGSAVLIRNLGNRQAVLDLTIKGLSTSVMKSEALKKD